MQNPHSSTSDGAREGRLPAVFREATRGVADEDAGISRAFDKAISVQRQAFSGRLKCMYFLNKQEIVHATNFLPLLELGKSLGDTYLKNLYDGENAKYTSERFVQVVHSLGETIRQQIKAEVKASPLFTLLIDETTDIALTKQLIIYCQFICHGEPKCLF